MVMWDNRATMHRVTRFDETRGARHAPHHRGRRRPDDGADGRLTGARTRMDQSNPDIPPHAAPPAPGETVEIAPGVLWFRIETFRSN